MTNLWRGSFFFGCGSDCLKQPERQKFILEISMKLLKFEETWTEPNEKQHCAQSEGKEKCEASSTKTTINSQWFCCMIWKPLRV